MHRSAALKILNRVRSSYMTEHTYRTVNADDFGHLSHDFYTNTQRSLEVLGFKHVADVEDETVKSQTPDPRTFLRIMATPDGIVNAAIYKIRPMILWRLFMFACGIRTTKVVEFQTELENGYQVLTTTVPSQDLLPTPPALFSNVQPRGTSVDELFRSHQDIIARVAREAGVKPKPNVTLDQILGFENRQMAMKREYLESVGWITEEYLRKQCGRDEKLAEQLYTEIQTILEEERQNA